MQDGGVVQEAGQRRTYTIWGFAALFVLLVAAGIYGVIRFGTYDREPTRRLAEQPVTTVSGAATTTSSVPVTLLDGTPAAADIEDVVVAPGEHTYYFVLPDDLTDEPTDSSVPPVTVAISEDERRLTVTMECAVSEGAVPALLRVTEDPFEVNVTPVVVGRSFGPACAADSVAGSVTVALEEPIGARRLVLAQEGLNVPLTGFG